MSDDCHREEVGARARIINEVFSKMMESFLPPAAPINYRLISQLSAHYTARAARYSRFLPPAEKTRSMKGETETMPRLRESSGLIILDCHVIWPSVARRGRDKCALLPG